MIISTSLWLSKSFTRTFGDAHFWIEMGRVQTLNSWQLCAHFSSYNLDLFLPSVVFHQSDSCILVTVETTFALYVLERLLLREPIFFLAVIMWSVVPANILVKAAIAVLSHLNLLAINPWYSYIALQRLLRKVTLWLYTHFCDSSDYLRFLYCSLWSSDKSCVFLWFVEGLR